MHKNVSILNLVGTGSEVIETCFLMDVLESNPDNKRPVYEADHSLAPSPEDWEVVELYLHFPMLLHEMVLV
jgi:hypothetical protein